MRKNSLPPAPDSNSFFINTWDVIGSENERFRDYILWENGATLYYWFVIATHDEPPYTSSCNYNYQKEKAYDSHFSWFYDEMKQRIQRDAHGLSQPINILGVAYSLHQMIKFAASISTAGICMIRDYYWLYQRNISGLAIILPSGRWRSGARQEDRYLKR